MVSWYSLLVKFKGDLIKKKSLKKDRNTCCYPHSEWKCYHQHNMYALTLSQNLDFDGKLLCPGFVSRRQSCQKFIQYMRHCFGVRTREDPLSWYIVADCLQPRYQMKTRSRLTKKRARGLDVSAHFNTGLQSLQSVKRNCRHNFLSAKNNEY